jgi:hypothetical protein
VALSAPATLAGHPLDVPWTLTGGTGLFGLDPVRGALAFWAILMGFTLLFLICSALLTRWQWGRLNQAEARAVAEERSQRQLTPLERARLRAEAGELIRQAAATAAAAKRAESTVAETRARREAAGQAREAAWVAFDTAQRAYEHALREAGKAGAHSTNGLGGKVNGNGHGPSTETSAADDEEKREVSRAALAAFRRGDITVDQLGAVFRQASGWDPVQELQAREVELRRTAESRARRLYQAAAAAERSAVKAADVAAVAAQALAEEAVQVADDAQAVRAELDATLWVPMPRRQRVPRQHQHRPRQRPRHVSQV